MKRGGPLRRGKPLRRRRRLKQMSDKTRDRLPERKAMTRATLDRVGAVDRFDTSKCEARDVVPEVACSGPLEVDECTPRGVRPGAQYEAAEGQALCQAHHRWKTAEPQLAHARGLRAWSWERETARRDAAGEMLGSADEDSGTMEPPKEVPT